MNAVRAALVALDDAGIAHCIRNDPQRVDARPLGDDVDIIVAGDSLAVVATVLGTHGFVPVPAPGHKGHHFFVTVERGTWHKLDVMGGAGAGAVVAERVRDDGLWVASPRHQAGHADARASDATNAAVTSRAARKRPAGWRRRGVVVALVGPDGSGKSTLLDALATAIPMGVTRVYLGSAPTGPAAVPVATPTTGRELAFVVRKWLRALGRLVPAYAAAWRAHVVLCDRHPIEILAVDPPRRPGVARLERMLLTRLLPAPDVLVVLDAPIDVLLARKREHEPAVLARWREGYREALVPRGATAIDTTAPLHDVAAATSELIWKAWRRRLRA
jgi:thymidylate kinase